MWRKETDTPLLNRSCGNLNFLPGSEPEPPSIPFTVPSLTWGRTESSMSLEGGHHRSAEFLPSSHRHFYSNASLGSLNPELYKNPEEGDLLEYPEGHMGRLWFTVEYDRDAEKLITVIGKARNLPSRDISCGNACDPFVRIFLLPDERRYVQTKEKRKSVNPNFGEAFTFEVARDTFEERVLKFVVFDIDTLQRYIPIGTVYYSLTDYARLKKQKLTTWRDLKRNDSEASCHLGELLCSLCYNPSMERFTVTIVKAKDLRPPDSFEEIDTFCKLTLSVANKQLKQKKTRTIKKNLNPSYSESFSFKLPPDKLEQTCLSIQVMQVKPERQIGRLTLAGSVYARGKQLEHWEEMVSQAKEGVQNWHYLSE